MSLPSTYIADPMLDLVLERLVDCPPHLIWDGWTQAEHLPHWFTPKPWRTVEAEIDLRPGGLFRTVMRSPEGQDFPNVGCYLEVVPGERLVWTSALGPGFRPQATPLAFTAMLTLEPRGVGTYYKAVAIHGNEEDCNRHADMGFHEGWSTVLDQLVTYMTSET